MRKKSLTIGAAFVLVVSTWMGGAALADDAAKTRTTGSTKPNLGNGPVEKSLPSSASPATRTQTTGATDQNKTVKTMNTNEKAKVETSGK
jgi:hypothetical protein